jgi:hypothetical protein
MLSNTNLSKSAKMRTIKTKEKLQRTRSNNRREWREREESVYER